MNWYMEWRIFPDQKLILALQEMIFGVKSMKMMKDGIIYNLLLNLMLLHLFSG